MKRIQLDIDSILNALSETSSKREAAEFLGVSADTLRRRMEEYGITDFTGDKILIWDLETGGINALKADLGFVLVFGWKWLNNPKVYSWKVTDYDNWFDKKTSVNDKPLLADAVNLMEQADILVAHYGDKFDRRFFQARCVVNKVQPPPPTKQRDTWRIAKQAFAFSSNRLGNLAKYLNLPEQKHEKGREEWPGWWLRAMAGDETAIEEMAKYCEQDVLTLEQVYLNIRQYDNNHPSVYIEPETCKVCGGDVDYKGFAHVGVYKYRRYQCTSCGRWGRDRKRIKE